MSGNPNKNFEPNKSIVSPTDGQLIDAMHRTDISGTDDKPVKIGLKLNEDGQPKIDIDDKKDKVPCFHDEQYAVSDVIGSQGKPLNIRVNRLAINYSLLPSKEIYCYSVSLPQIGDREVTKRYIKKELMQKVLGPGQPWSAAFAANRIFTDWEALIVTANLTTPSYQHSKALLQRLHSTSATRVLPQGQHQHNSPRPSFVSLSLLAPV